MTYMAGDDIDLAQILKTRHLSLSFRYVLILEWLGGSDEKTGTALAAQLSGKLGSDRVVLRPCTSAAQVRQALAEACAQIESLGWPIVHIEAHGHSPDKDAVSEGFVGPDGAGGMELLEWADFGDSLRPLNIASEFNLLLVGAACYGEGPILAIRSGMAMPFTAIVGYAGSVAVVSLRNSMAELYRGLFDRVELGEAVENADAQRVFPEDAALRLTSPTVLALEGYIQGISTRVGTETRHDAALDIAEKMVRLNGYDISALPYSMAKVIAPEVSESALRRIWAEIWMIDTFPENAERFAVDFKAAIGLATELTGNQKLRIKR